MRFFFSRVYSNNINVRLSTPSRKEDDESDCNTLLSFWLGRIIRPLSLLGIRPACHYELRHPPVCYCCGCGLCPPFILISITVICAPWSFLYIRLPRGVKSKVECSFFCISIFLRFIFITSRSPFLCKLRKVCDEEKRKRDARFLISSGSIKKKTIDIHQF